MTKSRKNKRNKRNGNTSAKNSGLNNTDSGAEEVIEGPNNKSFWNKRYENEGHIWGDEPSPTALELTDDLSANKDIIEVGFGYGRDIIEMVKHGHNVHGVEESSVGLMLAEEQLDKLGMDKRAHFVKGEFTTAALPEDYFDALLSHRMLHLLGDDGLVRAFAKKAHDVLKPGGTIYISARDPRDFNEDKMIRHKDGMAEYKDRPGHMISFWDEERFKKIFGKRFEDFEFQQRSEQESQMRTTEEDGAEYCPVAYFTIMKARKKTDGPAPK